MKHQYNFKISAFCLSLMLLFSSYSEASEPLWQVQEMEQASVNTSLKLKAGKQGKLFVLNRPLLAQKLTHAIKTKNKQALMELPLPDGHMREFYIVKASVMSDALASKFPEIETYRLQAVDDATVHGQMDWTSAGFHAMLFTRQGVVYVDPVQVHDTENYRSYFKHDALAVPREVKGVDFIRPPKHEKKSLEVAQKFSAYSTGGELLRYRLAVATTGEYTAFHGGTVPLGLSAVVTAVHRINGVYEQELAIHLELVDNNDQLIYTNASTDPYTNANAGALLDENQSTIDTIIGGNNYDLGHVFSTEGGGLAALGVVCDGNFKANGETGSSNPSGDAFWIDLVAHEIGHQFGADHTFNGTAGSCGGGNREPTTAYEPGSGTTIMAYAGLCGNQDIQKYSDPYFHSASFEQIQTYVSSGDGALCGTVTATNNQAPVLTMPVEGKTIPINTPFELGASASDANNDILSFSWEEFDLGPDGDPQFPSGQAPLFRSFLPNAAPAVRTFPRWQDLIKNTQTIGELLPSYSRSLNFRFIVRDNHLSDGGVAYDSYLLDVTNVAGPFRVTSPNSSLTWAAGDNETVTWDVANTDLAPVNCSNVDIELSLDQGLTYPFALADQVLNTGQYTVVVPTVDSNTARLKVSCSDNVFFDISDVDFNVTAGSECQGDNVIISQRDYAAGEQVSCSAAASIQIGPDVSLSSSTQANFSAPLVRLLPNVSFPMGSEVHLFTLPSTVVDDFSANTGTTGRLSLNVYSTGNIESSGDTDWFKISLSAGQQIQIDLEGAQTAGGTLVDPFINGVFDSSGVILSNTTDDDGGEDVNSRVTFLVPVTGDYFIAAGAFETETGTYSLLATLSAAGADDFSDNTATTGHLSLGVYSTGSIELTGDIDWFKISLSAGQLIQFDLEGVPTGGGTLIDTYIGGIYDSNGVLINNTSDDDDGVDVNSRITFLVPATGDYYIAAKAYDTETGTYSLLATLSAAGADDFSANTDTTGSLTPGVYSIGNIELSSDIDWFKILLFAGQQIQIDLEGSPTGKGALEDTLNFIKGSGYQFNFRQSLTPMWVKVPPRGTFLGCGSLARRYSHSINIILHYA